MKSTCLLRLADAAFSWYHPAWSSRLKRRAYQTISVLTQTSATSMVWPRSSHLWRDRIALSIAILSYPQFRATLSLSRPLSRTRRRWLHRPRFRAPSYFSSPPRLCLLSRIAVPILFTREVQAALLPSGAGLDLLPPRGAEQISKVKLSGGSESGSIGRRGPKGKKTLRRERVREAAITDTSFVRGDVLRIRPLRHERAVAV
jgi:hypothetical protein